MSEPFESPSLDTVIVSADGSVWCEHSGAALTTMEIGQLLEAMLPRDGSAPVPGGLRYTIARALLQVDAPPFQSVEQLSSALLRHEQGPRVTVIRELLARAMQTMPLPMRPRTDRRKNAPSPAFLRHELREADRRLFEQRRVATSFAPDDGAAASVEATLVDDRAKSLSAPLGTFLAIALVLIGLSGIAGYGARRMQLARTAVMSNAPAGTRTISSAGTAFFANPADVQNAALVRDDLRVMQIQDDGADSQHVQRSPDGNRIAFDSDRDGERGVYVARYDGGDVRRVSGPGYAAEPAWSPEGDRLAFIRRDDHTPDAMNLWIVSLGSGVLRRLTSDTAGGASGVSWFPDGRRLCYTRGDQIALLDLTTAERHSYSTPMTGRDVSAPAVSPDGQYVVFHVAGHGAWILSVDTGAMRSIVTDPTVEAFAWSSDGRRLAYHSQRDEEWGMWIMSAHFLQPAAP